MSKEIEKKGSKTVIWIGSRNGKSIHHFKDVKDFYAQPNNDISLGTPTIKDKSIDEALRELEIDLSCIDELELVSEKFAKRTFENYNTLKQHINTLTNKVEDLESIILQQSDSNNELTKENEELKKYKNYALSVGSIQSSKVPKLQSKLSKYKEVVEEIEVYGNNVCLSPDANEEIILEFVSKLKSIEKE